MIKISKYAFVGAAMLTGSMAFTACSSDSDATDNGSAVNPTGETVKTQFAINVPKAGSTRMSGDIVQEGESYTFRGITDIRLMPLTLNTSENKNVNSDTKLTKIIPLGNFGENEYNKGSNEYKIYSDVEIPVGTNHFLFYGVACSKNDAEKADIGSLETTLVDAEHKVSSDVATANDITFKLEQIASSSNDISTTETSLLELLNAIADANVDENNKWSTASKDDEYGKLYDKFTKLTSGSAPTILLTVQSLYNHVASSTTEGTIGNAIKKVIEEKFSVSNDGTVSYSDGINAKFPENLGLPQGALELQFTDGKFSYVEKNKNTVITNPSLDIDNLTYPASLYYFDNTALKATTDPSFNKWPSKATDWTSYEWKDWADAVAATSRTIALKDNINYGVAMLALTVKTNAKNLEDNAKTVAGVANNNKIVVPDEGFTVTGVLVGGQPTKSNWEFLPTTEAGKTYTVYDHSISKVNAKYSTVSDKNYTLLLDNRKYDGSTLANSQDAVNIAVEFTNNSGVAFYGQSGIIEPNQKFYLLAELNPQATKGVSKTDFAYEGTGLSENDGIIPVFVRDHKTVVNLTISSLSKAYNTIPDLRASNLQLGMSVDLKWENGLTFNVGLGD